MRRYLPWEVGVGVLAAESGFWEVEVGGTSPTSTSHRCSTPCHSAGASSARITPNTPAIITSFATPQAIASSSRASTSNAAPSTSAGPSSAVTTANTPASRLLAFCDYLSHRPIYWGNIDWTSVKAKNERSWIECADGKLSFMIIGKVYNNKLVKDEHGGKVDAWMIDLEKPATVASDFDTVLKTFKTQIRKKIKNASLNFAGNEYGIRLSRYYKDFPDEDTFPEVYDCSAATPATLNSCPKIDGSNIVLGSIVACTGFAKGWVYGNNSGARIELNSVRLLSHQIEDVAGSTPVPRTAVDI
ncbi:hypothetical protein P7C70_g6593, partial [Phenoliferia sp. Uapishka_3]